MTKAQFLFSLTSAIGLCCAGFALATGGIASWGLFWVGVGIATITLVNQVKPAGLLAPAPAAMKS